MKMSLFVLKTGSCYVPPTPGDIYATVLSTVNQNSAVFLEFYLY